MGPLWSVLFIVYIFWQYIFKINSLLHVCLAALGLSCVVWDISLWFTDCLWFCVQGSCPLACGIFVPGSGIEPMSSALQGRFLTTGPPGKSLSNVFLNKSYSCAWFKSWIVFMVFNSQIPVPWTSPSIFCSLRHLLSAVLIDSFGNIHFITK